MCHNPGVNMILALSREAQTACRTADGGSPGHRGLGAIVNVRTVTIFPFGNSLLTLITQEKLHCTLTVAYKNTKQPCWEIVTLLLF